MKHKIKKVNVFNFLKAESIIVEISPNSAIVKESANELASGCLQEVTLNLDIEGSKIWQMKTESGTFLEPNSKKVDSIILLEKDGMLHIVLIELKSTKIKNTDIFEKFEKSISWVYLLLNLLNGKEEQDIKVYGVLVAQRNKNWDEMDDLQIFSSTNIRYKKKSFHTTNTSMNINLSDIITA